MGTLNTYYYNLKMLIFKNSPKHSNIVKTYIGTNTDNNNFKFGNRIHSYFKTYNTRLDQI